MGEKHFAAFFTAPGVVAGGWLFSRKLEAENPGYYSAEATQTYESIYALQQRESSLEGVRAEINAHADFISAETLESIDQDLARLQSAINTQVEDLSATVSPPPDINIFEVSAYTAGGVVVGLVCSALLIAARRRLIKSRRRPDEPIVYTSRGTHDSFE